jgi:high-affinity iron transporter
MSMTLAPGPQLAAGAIVALAAALAFREGLEMVVVLNAVRTSAGRAGPRYARPVLLGAGISVVAAVLTAVLLAWAISALRLDPLQKRALSGVVVVVVLLVVMNWFFHRIYWTGWIVHHNGLCRQLVSRTSVEPGARLPRGVVVSLVLLGVSALYREGGEIAVFDQNLWLEAGWGAVLVGTGIGGALCVVFGVRGLLPWRPSYKRLLVFTGILAGGVLLVMLGETARELQAAGWLSATALPLPIPAALGPWLGVYPTLESLAAQVIGGGLVIGSYYFAEELAPRRRRRQTVDATAAP